MTKTRKHHWPTLLQAFDQSKLTQKQFCHQQGINPKYFSTRRLQLLKKENEGPSQFVKASIIKPKALKFDAAAPTNAAQMTLCLPHGELHFDTTVPSTYIAALLRNLS